MIGSIGLLLKFVSHWWDCWQHEHGHIWCCNWCQHWCTTFWWTWVNVMMEIQYIGARVLVWCRIDVFDISLSHRVLFLVYSEPILRSTLLHYVKLGYAVLKKFWYMLEDLKPKFPCFDVLWCKSYDWKNIGFSNDSATSTKYMIGMFHIPPQKNNWLCDFVGFLTGV